MGLTPRRLSTVMNDTMRRDGSLLYREYVGEGDWSFLSVVAELSEPHTESGLLGHHKIGLASGAWEEATLTGDRLAECWNACKGVPSELLRDGAVAEMLETLREAQEEIHHIAGLAASEKLHRLNERMVKILDT